MEGPSSIPSPTSSRTLSASPAAKVRPCQENDHVSARKEHVHTSHCDTDPKLRFPNIDAWEMGFETCCGYGEHREDADVRESVQKYFDNNSELALGVNKAQGHTVPKHKDGSLDVVSAP